MVNKFKTLELAYNNFSKSDFSEALREYALVLKDFPNSKEAYNGAVLSEMAMSGESGAQALFDYYDVLKKENSSEADTIIYEILHAMDDVTDNIGELISEPLNAKLEYEDGILYKDFLKIVEEDGDFKKIFENIMFSTRVIITQKEDFIDFLGRLIDNNYSEMAFSYLEGALAIYPNEERLKALVERIH